MVELVLPQSMTFEGRTIRAAIAWNIWKRRNTLNYNKKDEPLQATISRCISNICLWAHRCPKPTPLPLFLLGVTTLIPLYFSFLLAFPFM
jgi:hypothetical protein